MNGTNAFTNITNLMVLFVKLFESFVFNNN